MKQQAKIDALQRDARGHKAAITDASNIIDRYAATITAHQAKIEELERVNENHCKAHLMSIDKIAELQAIISEHEAVETLQRNEIKRLRSTITKLQDEVGRLKKKLHDNNPYKGLADLLEEQEAALKEKSDE